MKEYEFEKTSRTLVEFISETVREAIRWCNSDGLFDLGNRIFDVGNSPIKCDIGLLAAITLVARIQFTISGARVRSSQCYGWECVRLRVSAL